MIDLQEVAREIDSTYDTREPSSSKVMCLWADAAKYGEVASAVNLAISNYGKVDILINNAAIVRDKTIRGMSELEWDEVIDTDLKSVFLFTKSVLPCMVERQYGRIVNISSVIGRSGAKGQANYAAAKAGILGFTRSAAIEFAKYGITINAICPGFVRTDMWKGIPDDARGRIQESIPLKRPAEIEEIVKVVYDVIGWSYCTGATIDVNGAYWRG